MEFNPLLVGFLAFAAVALGIAVVGYSLVDRTRKEQVEAIRRLRELGGSDVPGLIDDGSAGSRLQAAVSKIGAIFDVRNGKGSERLKAKLALAGYFEPSTFVYFRGIQLVLIVGLSIGAGIGSKLCGASWLKGIMWTAMGGAAGFVGPSFILASRVKRRQRLIRNALPDALDIMVLSTEGGASLNAAISWVSEELEPVHPVLGAEIQIVQSEMQLGLSASEAFRGFADRCGIAEARDLAATLLQSERYGASVAKTLRAYSDAARQDRQAASEEMAHKAAVKIMFPMLICIFPAMFIVLLGPAAFQMSKLFSR